MPTKAVAPAINSTNKFVPITGRKASILLPDGCYYDCTVTKLNVRRKEASVEIDEDESTYVTPIHLLEKPLASDVNERFDYFRDLTAMVMHGKLKSLFVSGEGGIGKSFTLNEMIAVENFKEFGDETNKVDETLENGEDYQYVRIKGYTTPRALFDHLEMHKSKLCVFEDCDSALTDPTAQNILKAVLDTYERRRVYWMTKDRKATFEFTGSAIFLSNKNKADVNQALISRSVVIDLFMSAVEKIERMEFLLPGLDVAPSLSIDEKFDVLRLIDQYKFTVSDLNLRTLVKALLVYENGKNIDLTRYQILNG